MATRKHTAAIRSRAYKQMVRRMIDLQDRQRLVHASAATAMRSLLADPDDAASDAAQVLATHVLEPLDQQIADVRALVADIRALAPKHSTRAING